MAASPEFKVYREGEYVAACKYAEDAAALVAMRQSGQIRHGHSHVVWDEGNEDFEAGESYDGVAQIVYDRIDNKLTNYATKAERGR